VLFRSNNSGEYEYRDTAGTVRQRFLADVYGKKTIEDLSNSQKNQSAEGLITYLCTDKTYGYGINQKKLSKEQVLQLVNIRYHISLNSFQKYIATTMAEQVSDRTVASIMENIDALQGVSIEETSLRSYPDSMAFASIIGYTGKISLESYNALSASEKKIYDRTDIVGQSGIEEVMDKQLQGEKGSLSMYVNNVGKVIATDKGKSPSAGNDVYLSIDATLQKATYQIIEQELAGLLLQRIQNILSFDKTGLKDVSDIVIPIGDVYHSIISNNIVDMGHFDEADAGPNEKAIYATFSSHKEEMLALLDSTFKDPNATNYQDSSREMQGYLTYIISDFLTTEVDLINPDTEDDLYKQWSTNEALNPYQYLNGAIAKNWIDTSVLAGNKKEQSKYTDADEIYNDLVEYILKHLQSDNAFDKLIYKYLIRGGSLGGGSLCMTLYEQGVLQAEGDPYYEQLASGTLGAYDFMRAMITLLRITPGQIGLEPCTGSMVINNPKTGELLACVSYPGYDNNRLANIMDADYYNKLVTDQSRPFYNNATQEKTAPGSTFKPLMAVTGLTEGVMTPDTWLNCSGIYEKVEPNPKCWIYPEAHGALNTAGAICESCNDYFYEVGYRLGLSNDGLSELVNDNAEGELTNKYYSSDKGVDTITKYATEFGLNEKSGIEIPEASPQISDTDSVLSAIGQGTNNYTVSQLARYVMAVANRGEVYDLTLLNSVKTVKGDVLESYTPKKINEITNVSSNTWDTVQLGMRLMVSDSHVSTFGQLDDEGVHMAGKTGTAQQSKTHPDHALFIGYAPYDNPEVSFAIRIANGYGSLYPSEIARDVMKYYFKTEDESQILTGEAAKLMSQPVPEG
jgi:penicillin-binding protein 2